MKSLKNIETFSTLFLTLSFLTLPEGAMAAGVCGGITQAKSLGDVLCNATANTSALNIGINSISYIMAIFLGYSSISKFREHAEDPRTGLKDPVFRMAGAGMLLGFPFMLDMVHQSFFNGQGFWSPNSYAASNGGKGTGLDTLMVNLANNIVQPGKEFLRVLCYILGGVLGVSALARLAKIHQDGARGPTAGGTLFQLVIAGVLIGIADLMDVVTNSLFGGSKPANFSSLAYSTTSLGFNPNNIFTAVFAWVQLIGWIGFIRGWWLLKSITNGENHGRSHLGAFTHIIFGAIAVNMAGFVRALQTSLGIQIIT